jgi:hypothetical protein
VFPPSSHNVPIKNAMGSQHLPQHIPITPPFVPYALPIVILLEPI